MKLDETQKKFDTLIGARVIGVGMSPTTESNYRNPHHKPLIIMEPLVGIEPTTYSLRVNCSTPELQRP